MLTATDLSIARGGVVVLEGVSLQLSAGEVLVLRGPNGCGKTTLLRTLSGLQPPTAGQIEMGSDTLAYGSHADGIKPTLTVRENLEFWSSVFGTGDAQIEAAIEAMDLRTLVKRPAQNLSAGQKRRLGLARLAVTGRPLWALDEPTVSLDAASVERFADMVRGHLAKGGAALIATHIDLGLPSARVLDLSVFRASAEAQAASAASGFDEAFL